MRHTVGSRLRALLLVALYAVGSFGIADTDALIFHRGERHPHHVAAIGGADRAASHDQTCLLGFSAPANTGAPTVRAPACRTEAPVRLETPAPARGPASPDLPTPHQPRAPPAALA